VIFVIETVYSNEGQDPVRNGKAPTSFKMPKNIRQVGKSNAQKKIYVEDYVMTYIKQLTGGEYSGCKFAVLVGQCIKLDNCRNIFISGALEVRNIDTEAGFCFNNDIWDSIYEDIKKYFVDAEIVGWFIGGPGYLLEDEDKLLKVHVDNFAGQDKTLLTYDIVEKEEAFYSYDNSRLYKQEGYYIYYEKNEEMQTYMIEQKKELSGEASYDDKVSREIRTVLQNKKPAEEDNKSVTRLMYAAGTLLAVIILVVGAAILNNYDQMKSMKNTMDSLSRNMDEIMGVFNNNGEQQAPIVDNNVTDIPASNIKDQPDQSNQTGDSLNVEVVPGNVNPIPDTSQDADNQDTEVKNDKPDDDTTNSDPDGEKAADNTKDDAAEAAGGQNDTQLEEVKYYTVQSGDTLADISYKLYKTYTKVKTIMKLNNIKDQDLIFAGQKIIVP
jgi:LysM repeat protein